MQSFSAVPLAYRAYDRRNRNQNLLQYGTDVHILPYALTPHFATCHTDSAYCMIW